MTYPFLKQLLYPSRPYVLFNFFLHPFTLYTETFRTPSINGFTELSFRLTDFWNSEIRLTASE
jgi:hypothetical protein